MVHLIRRADANDAAARFYIQVTNLDSVHAGCVEARHEPTKLEYRTCGTRDFDLVGPEEILVGIGSEFEHQAAPTCDRVGP